MKWQENGSIEMCRSQFGTPKYVEMESGLAALKFSHFLHELGGGFAEFFFEGFGEVGLGLDADAVHDVGEGGVFVGHDLDGLFEADRADEVADGLLADAFYFLVEFSAAHAHFLAEVFDVEVGVDQLGVDDLEEAEHKFLVSFGVDEFHGFGVGITGIAFAQAAILVESVADGQQEQLHIQGLGEIVVGPGIHAFHLGCQVGPCR